MGGAPRGALPSASTRSRGNACHPWYCAHTLALAAHDFNVGGGGEEAEAEDNPEDETDEEAEDEAREEAETEEAEDYPQHAAVYLALVSIGLAPVRCAALTQEHLAGRETNGKARCAMNCLARQMDRWRAQPRGAIDDWHLQQAQGAGVDGCNWHCSAEGRHRRVAPLQQTQGARVDVCH